jgi:hypothetical protein
MVLSLSGFHGTALMYFSDIETEPATKTTLLLGKIYAGVSFMHKIKNSDIISFISLCPICTLIFFSRLKIAFSILRYSPSHVPELCPIFAVNFCNFLTGENMQVCLICLMMGLSLLTAQWAAVFRQDFTTFYGQFQLSGKISRHFTESFNFEARFQDILRTVSTFRQDFTTFYGQFQISGKISRHYGKFQL